MTAHHPTRSFAAALRRAARRERIIGIATALIGAAAGGALLGAAALAGLALLGLAGWR